MKVETMIYAYLAVCFCMIIFDTVCVIVFNRRDALIKKRSRNLEKIIEEQISLICEGKETEDSHKKYLQKCLRKSGNMLAFDETLEKLTKEKPKETEIYIRRIYPVFVYLLMEYQKKDETMVTFYLYILRKYKVLHNKPFGTIFEVVQTLIQSDSIYCRENALQTIYSSGDADSVVRALLAVDRNGYYHNPKLISDGLLSYSGNSEILSEKLWANFEKFSLDMKLNILNYFRFSSSEHKDRMLSLLADRSRNDEIRFSAIRYFGKYPDQRAYPLLIELAKIKNEARWEYSAIASFALGSYPSEHTLEILKDNLHSASWHIRFNAAQSLSKIGFDYVDLIDIFEGEDRYAREMIQYRMDQKKEKEMISR